MAEEITPEEKSELNYGAREVEVNQAIANVPEGELPLEGLPIEVAVSDIGSYENEQYALIRRGSFGASDVSVLLGVNPYKTVQELIHEKTLPYLTAEEKAIGEKSAVKKGRDLEPLIIEKFIKYFQLPTIKPEDMYRFKEYPFLTINFDGVTTTENGLIPVEVKVVTKFGMKKYNLSKSIFNEMLGFKELPLPMVNTNNSIQTKAGHYGIPPYYYCQLQQQVTALNAPYGYLIALLEETWSFHVFMVWRDDAIFKDSVIQGYKAQQQIDLLKARNEHGQERPQESQESQTIQN